MKKIIKEIWILAMLLSVALSGYAFEVNGIYYGKNSDGKTVCVTAVDAYYSPYSGSVVIPSTVTYSGTTYSVTSIASIAFQNCSGLTSVTIPNSVTSIGEEAFYGCSGLTSVTIPNSVTEIGADAFKDCSGLTSVTIPNSVTKIGYEAFKNCSGLTSVTIGNSVTSIGADAFTGCSGLTKVEISDIAAWCNISFWSNEANPLFNAEHLYLNGKEVTNLVIPNSVTSIGEDAFHWCSGLTSVTIPNSVTSIGDEAFKNCSGLTSVTIGNSVTSIGDEAFRDCSGLIKVEISDIAAWCNISFGSNDANPLYYANHLYQNGKEVTNLVIPNSVTSIGYEAFYNCSGLKSVTIPNSVTSIGEAAFWYCSGLTSVTIGNSVISIGEEAFTFCSGLTKVEISDIAAWCNISFGNSGANPLYNAEHLYLNGKEATNLVIPNSVTSIGEEAFYYCSELKLVRIPNSITSIGESAFSGCSPNIRFVRF